MTRNIFKTAGLVFASLFISAVGIIPAVFADTFIDDKVLNAFTAPKAATHRSIADKKTATEISTWKSYDGFVDAAVVAFANEYSKGAIKTGYPAAATAPKWTDAHVDANVLKELNGFTFGRLPAGNSLGNTIIPVK
jgi:hypothetical protein